MSIPPAPLPWVPRETDTSFHGSFTPTQRPDSSYSSHFLGEEPGSGRLSDLPKVPQFTCFQRSRSTHPHVLWPPCPTWVREDVLGPYPGGRRAW